MHTLLYLSQSKQMSHSYIVVIGLAVENLPSQFYQGAWFYQLLLENITHIIFCTLGNFSLDEILLNSSLRYT